MNNKDSIAAYHQMAEEIWTQTQGQVDGFVQSVCTAGSLRGNAEALRRHNPQIRIVTVEPSESAVLSGGQAGAHKIDGVGTGFVVPLWQLFAGTSTGGNVIAILRLAEQLGPGATVVTVMCDTGVKYLRKVSAT
jgi:cysteine synthase A